MTACRTGCVNGMATCICANEGSNVVVIGQHALSSEEPVQRGRTRAHRCLGEVDNLPATVTDSLALHSGRALHVSVSAV